MIDGFQGEVILVKELRLGEKDSFGNQIRKYSDVVTVDDVLISPADANDSIDEGEPYGADIVYKLYIPKGVNIKWRDAIVSIHDEKFQVVGDPRPYPSRIVPTGRNLVVKVVRYEGH